MTKYTLVSDKLYMILDYYIGKAKNCKDFFECYFNIAWFLVETGEIISKSTLDYSDKKKLLIWINSEISVLYMYYKMHNID